MTTTIFLHDPKTLRVSFPYAPASVLAIKQLGGARWDPASRTWRVPLDRLDALLAVFGEDAAVAPEVFMAADATLQEVAAPRTPATPEQRLGWFLDTLVWAGVTLRIEGERVVGSGGCWTPVLQKEIDRRAPALRAKLLAGWQPLAATAAPAPAKPVSLDLITHMDYVLAAGERNALANEAKKARLIEAAKSRKRKELFQKFDQQLGIEGI